MKKNNNLSKTADKGSWEKTLREDFDTIVSMRKFSKSAIEKAMGWPVSAYSKKMKPADMSVSEMIKLAGILKIDPSRMVELVDGILPGEREYDVFDFEAVEDMASGDASDE